MLVAMLDVATGRPVVSVVVWAAVLLLSGMALGLVGGRRSRAVAADRAMTVHAGLGCVVMAALLVLMIGGSGSGADPPSHHGGSVLAVTVLAFVTAVAYAGVSFVAARRGRWQERAQRLGMGAAALAMGVAALV